MAKYVFLIKWTSQGMKNIKDSPNRRRAAEQAFEAVGGKMETFLVTMGQYDAVAITSCRTTKPRHRWHWRRQSSAT